MSARVALDTNSRYVTRAGTTRFVDGLLAGLWALKPAGFEFAELAWPVDNFSFAQPARAMKTVYRELVWSRWVAPRELQHGQVDLLHRCTPALPIEIPRGVKEVVALHDVAPLRHPERFRRWHGATAARRLHRLHQADRIICSSRFTADEAQTLLGLPAARLDVVYLGNRFASDMPSVEAAPPDVQVPERFFLFVGSLEPGKNLALLARAYVYAAGRGLDLPPLVVVGERRVGVAGEGDVPASWNFVGHQTDAALKWLYQHAIALAFPSLYEGFGFPVVEAMGLGCPVICSPLSSLPEVAGPAARMTASTPEAYCDAMAQLARDDRARAEHISLGHAQAARFSWRRCATETVEVYRRVLGR